MAEGDQYASIRIIMDLPRLGELIGFVAGEFARIREIEAPDYTGDEMRQLAIGGWNYVCHMNERAAFAESVLTDLAQLDSIPTTESKHRPEFSGTDVPPLGWTPPVI